MRAGGWMLKAKLPQVGGREVDGRISEVDVPCRVDLKKGIGENVDGIELAVHLLIGLHGSRWRQAAGHGVTRESGDVVRPVCHENTIRRDGIGCHSRLGADRQCPTNHR